MKHQLFSFVVFLFMRQILCETLYSRSPSVFENQEDIIEITLPASSLPKGKEVEHAADLHKIDVQSESIHLDVPGGKRKKRSTDRDTHSRLPYSTKFDLQDDHTNAMISWAGKTPDVVALTKSYGRSKRSNLYISTDYGRNFTNVVAQGWSCLCTHVGGVTKYASIDNLYHASSVQSSRISATSYIFTDTANRLIVYTRNLRQFTTVHVDFQPITIVFHPVREDVVVAYGSANSSFGGIRRNLYISYDFGAEWTLVKSNVHDFQWGWNADQIFVMVPSFLGISAVANVYDVQELTYDDGIKERVVVSNVVGFQIEGSFMFATKRALPYVTSSKLSLYVAKNGTNFMKAEFPVLANYSNQEYYIVDADEDRVMVCVVHAVKSTHLYVSDSTGTQYTLSLPNIVYISSSSVSGTALPGLRYYTKPFADVHKVKGLKGIYIASQFLSNSSGNASSLADMNQTTRITFDKGGEWTHISAPYRDMDSRHTHCFWYTGCTLHLLQDFLFGSSYRSEGLLSSSNAVGLVLGAGVLGYTLKQETNPSIFLSTDAGFNWKEIARGNYTYNFGDHGNLIVLVPLRKVTKTLIYSHDEGETWNEYTFSDEYMNVYGLLTEPGTKSGNFSIWGSKPGRHSWIIVHVNLVNIFPGSCNSTDYKDWSPGVNVTSKEICLLGEQEVIERKIPSSFCFNGKDYERLKYSKTCKCVRSDYECDYGYIRVNETEDIWNPLPSIHFTDDIGCVRDYDVVNITLQKPDFCPYGTSYEITKGYRKIPGDVCQGGDDHKYDKIHRHCPNTNKTDFIIYSTGTDIYKYDLVSRRKEFLVKGTTVSEIYSVEFDYNRDILFWADQDSDSVMYYNISAPFPTPQTLVSGNLGKIESLSLDWESDNIYLLDSTTPKIEIFTIFTHWRRTILQNNETYPDLLENPRGLDIFPLHGLMFWTDWSATSPRVMRAGMSGLNATVVITGKESGLLYWPNGLAVDFDKELIYIIDGFKHNLIVCGLDGSNVKVMLSDPIKIKHPFSLSLLKDRLYWSDWTDYEIKSVYRDKDIADGFYVVTSSEQRIMSVKGMNWDKQYQARETGCGTSNGGCSNICVPSAHPNQTVSTHRYCLCSDEAKPHDYVTNSNEECHCKAGENFNLTSGNCERSSATSSCASDEFACSSGTRCIPKSWLCDREGDCPDDSDEYNCPSQLCESDQFLCKSTQRCINDDWLCDGDNDCGDLSDEQHCDAECGEGKFQCDNKRCILARYKCDGENDCGFGDNSDEANCTTEVTTCSSSQFHCQSTRYGLTCIPTAWKCDREPDCDDSSDEHGCGDEGCTQYQFACANNASKCIPRNWLCDHDNDCGDFSDERNCSTTTPRSTTSFPSSPLGCLCTTHDGRCVSLDAQCDGFVNCPDGRDELWCEFTTTHRIEPCYDGFRCSDGKCLSASQVCDGTNDCHISHEDEANCKICRPDQIRCALNHRQCINSTQLCDGISNCFGGTDEEGCHNSTLAPPSCSSDSFKCKTSGICIALQKMCDDRWDCSDGSDEDICDVSVRITEFRRGLITSTSAQLSWVSQVVGAGLTVKYVVQYMYVHDIRTHQVNNSRWLNATITTATGTNITDLEPYTNYMFHVRAIVTSEKQEKLGKPSQVLRLSTLEAAPGPVGHITAKVDEEAEDPGYWIFSWHYPLHPRGHIFKYMYSVTTSGGAFTSGEKEVKDTGLVEMRVYVPISYDIRSSRKMTVTVWAVNGAGAGEKLNLTHCVELITPTIRCAASAPNSVGVLVKSNQKTESYNRWKYVIRVSTIDMDGIPQAQTVDLDSKLEDYDVTMSNLAAGKGYTISAEVERWDLESSKDARPTCTSGYARALCTTTGEVVKAVTGVTIQDITANTAKISWDKVQGAVQYEVVMATEKVKLEEGDYLPTRTSKTNSLTIDKLIGCEMYFVAVRVKLPYAGPRSAPRFFKTLDDYLGPPRHIKPLYPPGDGLRSLVFQSRFSDMGDPISVNITWKPTCHQSRGDHIVYLTGEDTTIEPQRVNNGTNYWIVTLERGGSYSVVIQNALPGGKNSSAVNFSPAPYKRPTIYLYNDTNGFRYKMMSYYKDLVEPYYPVLGYVPVLYINVQYKYDDGEYVNLGNYLVEEDGPLNVTLDDSVYNYTVRARYVRAFQRRYYYGDFGYSWLTINQPQKIAYVASTSASTHGPKGQIGMYVGITVSAVVVLVLTVLLSIWCVRHRRLQRSFMDFTTSHYNTRTDNATFNNDDDDSPLIQGFSDDEPLVIA